MSPHADSRYVGDLFGGQMMAGMATKSLRLQPDAENGGGLAFYNFRDIADTREFIDKWYTALNKLDLTSAQKAAIVDEANLVFALNIELFDELEGNPAKAAFSVLAETAIDWLRAQATQRPPAVDA